jgi:hypothetical protein
MLPGRNDGLKALLIFLDSKKRHPKLFREEFLSWVTSWARIVTYDGKGPLESYTEVFHY